MIQYDIEIKGKLSCDCNKVKNRMAIDNYKKIIF